MEKHHSRSSSKRVLPVDVDVDSFDLSSLGIGSGIAPPRAAVSGLAVPDKTSGTDKLSREDISRCINIWASVYLGRETPTEARELLMPSRPWIGRNPNALKRFE